MAQAHRRPLAPQPLAVIGTRFDHAGHTAFDALFLEHIGFTVAVLNQLRKPGSFPEVKREFPGIFRHFSDRFLGGSIGINVLFIGSRHRIFAEVVISSGILRRRTERCLVRHAVLFKEQPDPAVAVPLGLRHNHIIVILVGIPGRNQRDAFQVVDTADRFRPVPGLVQSGQQHRGKDRDNCNYY